MDMVKPPEMSSRLDLVVLELAAAGIVFRRYSRGFWDFRGFIELRGGGGSFRGAHHPPGRAVHPWHGLGGVGPLPAPFHRLSAL
jgi:hypothetical protein